jgi:hypothetical protein
MVFGMFYIQNGNGLNWIYFIKWWINFIYKFNSIFGAYEINLSINVTR